MKIARAVWCAVVLMAGCTPATEEEPFADKGLGVWVAAKGAPAISYRAVWGVNAREVYAVGDGGAAVGGGGTPWQLLETVPPASYRAVWGRSPSEIWMGGDGILLARALSGWQAQTLFDGAIEITDYSVMALGGDSREEYAIVLTGGELLLLVNRGSAWETVSWRDGRPAWPLPREPQLFARESQILVVGAGDAVRCSLVSELGIARWEAHRWPLGVDLPRLAAASGGEDFWAGAGGDYAVVLDDGEEEPTLIAVEGGGARAVHARSAGALFAIGETIQACDREGCALETVEGEAKGLRAAWGDGDDTVVAAGDGVVLERETGR